MRSIGAFIFFVFFLASCGDPVDVPRPDQSDPVFVTNLIMDGKPRSWAAGENGLAFKTAVQKLNKEIIFISTLAERDCTAPCPNSLEFILQSNIPDQANFSMDRALLPASKKYRAVSLSDSLELKILNNSERLESRSIQWKVNNRRVLPKFRGDTLIFRTKKNARMEICLSGSDVKGHLFTQCQTFTEGNFKNPRTTILARLERRQVVLKAKDVDNPSGGRTEGKWDHNGSTSKEIIVPQGQIRNEYCYTTKVLNSDLVTKSCIRLASDDVSGSGSSALFGLKKLRRVLPLPRLFRGNAEVNYIDDSGRRFSTRWVDNRTSKYEILEQETFMDPNTMKDLYQIKVEWSALLANDQGEQIRIEEATSVIPIEIVE